MGRPSEAQGVCQALGPVLSLVLQLPGEGTEGQRLSFPSWLSSGRGGFGREVCAPNEEAPQGPAGRRGSVQPPRRLPSPGQLRQRPPCDLGPAPKPLLRVCEPAGGRSSPG